MKRSTVNRLIVLLFVIGFAVAALAQSDTARLTGVITDVQGALVSDAEVTLTNLGTGRVQTVTSGPNGEYNFNALPPGQYKIEIKSGNFKAITQTITLQTSQAAAANFTLQPGTVNETIEVKNDIPLVETASSSISDVVVGRQITDLPLNGRNFTQLATLVPGVTRGVQGGQATGAGNQAETFRYNNTGGAALSVNGLRPQANNFLMDGIDNNESLVNTVIFFPPAEAIQEFRVDTSVAPAEFGRAGGGVVNTTMKSGTNTWHGSAFDFLRNDALDAQRYFDSQKNEFRRNQFGAQIGGAIIKNKLFIFGDYQGLRQFTPYETGWATVPTAKMRTGDFTELIPAGINLIDPRTGASFATPNVVDPAIIVQAGQNYLSAFPTPNVAATDSHCSLAAGGVCLQGNYFYTRNQIQHYNDFDIRSDFVLGSKDTMFGRFSYGKEEEDTGSRLGTLLPAGFGSGLQFNYPRSIAFGETHTFTNSLINEFRFGWIHTRFGYTPPQQSEALSASLGIPNANTSSLLGGGALIGGGNGSHIEYTGDYGPYLVPQDSYQFSDSLSWVKGSHNVKVGGTVIKRNLDLFRPKAGKGFFSFNEQGGPGSTGYEVSDMIAGFVNNYQVGPNFGQVGTHSWEMGYFAQDDWKISRRLTVNLGIRYDLFTWPTADGNLQSNFDISTGKLLLAGENGNSASLLETDKNNFAPRIGFAYDIMGDGKTVLRGGYGVFYFVDRGGIDNQLAQNPPFSGTYQVTYDQGYRISLGGLAPNGTNNPAASTADALTSTFPKNKVYVDPNNPVGIAALAELPSNRNSYVQEWNIQLQRELGANTALSIGYVGTKGTKLSTYYNLNRQEYDQLPGTKPFPNLGDITVLNTNGNSIYHSLQTNLSRRLANGAQFNVAYTWSHTIDDSPGAFDNQSSVVDIANFRAERANSNLDVRHRLVASALIELPFGKGKALGHNWGGVANTILGGWQINPILTLQSGMPYDLTSSYLQLNTRPDLIGDPNQSTDINNWVTPAAFANPPVVDFTAGGAIVPSCPENHSCVYQRWGNAPRNFLTGPAHHYLDMSVFKDFPITERVRTQFRAEFFNLTNTPQFGQPNGDFSSGDFGKVKSILYGTERQIQLALRLMF